MYKRTIIYIYIYIYKKKITTNFRTTLVRFSIVRGDIYDAVNGITLPPWSYCFFSSPLKTDLTSNSESQLSLFLFSPRDYTKGQRTREKVRRARRVVSWILHTLDASSCTGYADTRCGNVAYDLNLGNRSAISQFPFRIHHHRCRTFRGTSIIVREEIIRNQSYHSYCSYIFWIINFDEISFPLFPRGGEERRRRSCQS